MTNISDKVICVEGLTKRFGSFTAVDHITFDVKKGEIFGFLGANGAGKTTAMKMLCGLSKPSGGSGQVVGKDILSENESIKEHIGYMSQKFSLFGDLTVKENIRLYAGIYRMRPNEIKEKTYELLNDLGLYDYRNTLVQKLPLGWKQKLAFSIAIVHAPDLVFLDEPTGGVDPVTRRSFWEQIFDAAYRRGITVFVTTHYMDEAEYCDRVSIMVDGQIRALGAPRELKKAYQVESIDQLFKQLARGTSNK